MSDSNIRVCVYASSASKTSSKFVEAARELGVLIAKRGCICTNGAGRFGCMGGLNEGCLSEGGHIIGVIHEKFVVDFGEHKEIKELIVSKGADLTERKQLLMDNADCLLVLPGGVGTFDEFWESVSGKALGMKGLAQKPICLINIDGFYDGFLMQMRRTYEEGMLYSTPESYFHAESTSEKALEWCLQEVAANRSAGESALDDDGGSNSGSSRMQARVAEASSNSPPSQWSFDAFVDGVDCPNTGQRELLRNYLKEEANQVSYYPAIDFPVLTYFIYIHTYIHTYIYIYKYISTPLAVLSWGCLAI